MLKKFRRISIQDVTLSRFQDAVSDYLFQFDSRPQLDSSLLTSISLTTGQDNKVAHGLGRAFQGWQLIDLQADARVWRNSAATDTDLFITLDCSANCVVSLLVF